MWSSQTFPWKIKENTKEVKPLGHAILLLRGNITKKEKRKKLSFPTFKADLGLLEPDFSMFN